MPSDEYIRDLENSRVFHSYGYDEGYKDGYAKGYEQGRFDATQNAIDSIDEWIKEIKETDDEQRQP